MKQPKREPYEVVGFNGEILLGMKGTSIFDVAHSAAKKRIKNIHHIHSVSDQHCEPCEDIKTMKKLKGVKV